MLMAYFREVATELDEQTGWRLFFFFDMESHNLVANGCVKEERRYLSQAMPTPWGNTGEKRFREEMMRSLLGMLSLGVCRSSRGACAGRPPQTWCSTRRCRVQHQARGWMGLLRDNVQDFVPQLGHSWESHGLPST